MFQSIAAVLIGGEALNPIGVEVVVFVGCVWIQGVGPTRLPRASIAPGLLVPAEVVLLPMSVAETGPMFACLSSVAWVVWW